MFDPHLALLLGAALLFIALFIPFLFYRLGKQPGQALIVSQSHLREACTTYLANQADLLLFAADEHYRQTIEREEQSLLNAQRRMTSINGFASALMMGVSSNSSKRI